MKSQETITNTTGHRQLSEFAPLFAHLNDDILFGEVWNDPSLDVKTRGLLTVCALTSQGITDSSLAHHIQNAKKQGVTADEMSGAITHTAMYAGWPKAWAAFRLAKEVYSSSLQTKEEYQASIAYEIGEENVKFAPYFEGKSYSAPAADGINHITFEPGCKNHWHIHQADQGGGQVLVCTGGRGWYQQWGQKPVLMEAGSVIRILANVKHWHGADDNHWFSHLSINLPGKNASTTWLEAVE